MTRTVAPATDIETNLNLRPFGQYHQRACWRDLAPESGGLGCLELPLTTDSNTKFRYRTTGRHSDRQWIDHISRRRNSNKPRHRIVDRYRFQTRDLNASLSRDWQSGGVSPSRPEQSDS